MASGRGPGPLPPRWLKCPRKSVTLIGNRYVKFQKQLHWNCGCTNVLTRWWFISRFLAFKTPLDERFNDQIPPEHRFTPDMLFQSMKAHKVKIGLVIDLTNTERFYDKKLMEENECKYVKLSCRGHGETPSPDAVKTFVHICKTYIANNPLDIVGVHCTHGFNRWIFILIYFELICLIRKWLQQQ